MNYKISDDRKTLTIRVNEAERQELRELGPFSVAADDYMHGFLEPIICNSELEWINPADTGDLTDAPVLGVLGESKMISPTRRPVSGEVMTGCAGRSCWIAPILERWAFMDYQVRSVLEDLRDKGEAIFTS